MYNNAIHNSIICNSKNWKRLSIGAWTTCGIFIQWHAKQQWNEQASATHEADLHNVDWEEKSQKNI